MSCQARSKPRAVGTRVAVQFAGWPASNETIVANPRRRRGEAVASSRCVSWHSSNPSPRWLRHGTVEPRPRIFRDRYARGLRHLRSLLRRAPSVPTTAGYALLTCHDLSLPGDSGGTQGNAEADVEAPVRRGVPVPVRRPTKRGHVEPTAATVHADRALARTTRIAD